MDSWKEMDEISFEITFLEIKYSILSKKTKALITFPQYAAYRNPHWSKEDILHGIIIAKEKRAATARWLEEQRNPTPIRSTQLCYSCKVPWEPDHRCRGKDQQRIIEAHYDSDDEVCENGAIDVDLEQSDDDSDSCTEASDNDSTIKASDSCTVEEDSDPCTLDEQRDGQDDSTYASAVISHIVDDLAPQQSGDTREGSHVLAPTSDDLPMRVMTHLSSFQTPMTATSYEDSSSIAKPCVRDAQHGHMDPQIQEETYDVQTVDLTFTHQHEEIESQIWETPLVEQIVETDRLMEHVLPGSACIHEDALFIGQDDHSTCLDTSIWDSGADDSSMVSAQEDTGAHTRYSVMQRELEVDDDT
jgi:hypothetical protein